MKKDPLFNCFPGERASRQSMVNMYKHVPEQLGRFVFSAMAFAQRTDRRRPVAPGSLSYLHKNGFLAGAPAARIPSYGFRV